MQNENKSGLDLLEEKIEGFGFESLTSSEQWFYAACWFIRETNCNAIHGYFFNHAGAHCKLALRGFRTIGARQTADILQRAIFLFPDGNIPADHAERQVALGDLGEDVEWRLLSRLSDELFGLKEDVAELAERYLAAHPDEFPTLAAKIENLRKSGGRTSRASQ